MIGMCIRCGNRAELIQSHVVSAFLGRRIFPEPGTKAYKLRMGTTRPVTTASTSPSTISWRQSQDLPKPWLMCQTCDGGLSEVERSLANWMDAIGIGEKHCPIYSAECLKPTELPELPEFCEYELPDAQNKLVRRVALITAWRALHATAQSSSTPGVPSAALAYIQSSRGRDLHEKVLNFLNSQDAPEPGFLSVLVPPYALAVAVSGHPDVAPFGWDVLIHHGPNIDTFIVAVWFAHWLLLWVPDHVHPDPVVAELVARIFMSNSAQTWPLEILAPRTREATSGL